MATTPTNKPIPSEDPRDLKFNAGKIDEEVNGSADYYTDRFGAQRLTNTGRNNQFQTAQDEREAEFVASQADKEARFQQFLLSSGYQFLGDYENGPYTINELNQVIRYQGELWRLNSSTTPPYTTTGVNSTSWTVDVTHLVSVGDANLRQELASSSANNGGYMVALPTGISVSQHFDNSSPRISDYGVASGDELTPSIFSTAVAKAQATTGIIIVDVNCIIDSLTLPDDVSIRVGRVRITHRANASGHMFISSNDSVVIGNDKYSRIRGNSANQSAIRRCFSAVGVSGAGIERLDIRDFNSYGAYFSGCEDTFCLNSTIRDITGGAVETAAGQYVTNCLRHESKYNDIRDTGSNGIKFRADSLGLTVGCRSIGDKVYRAGFIGIANGTCRDHIVENAYCEGCVDNGCDMNGCDNAQFINCESVNCQDGFYMGENNINNCHIKGCSARLCRRSGVGSLGSLTRCSVSDTNIDACGSGIYCSGFVGFKIRGGSITNCVKQSYTDSETGTVKTSTGIGIDLQSNLSSCFRPDISGVTFYGNAGRDIAMGSSGTIGNLLLGECDFQDSAGDGKISYGGATLADPQIRNSQGYIVSRTQAYSISGDGTTTDFTLSLPEQVTDTNYRIVSVVPDWLTTMRYLDSTKTTSLFGISFGTAPPSGTRRLNVTFERLRPAS